MNYFEEINSRFPVRRKDEQKRQFRDYINQKAKKYGYLSKTDNADKNNNIIIGDIEKAEVIFTAHYDTPATAIMPNLMMPLNKGLNYIIKFGYYIILAAIAIVAALLIANNFFDGNSFFFLLYYALFYVLLMYLTVLCFTNKNNYNDNTSGVSCIMSLVSEINSDKVAFILFDNEEKGLLGSKAHNKKYLDIMKDKLVINLDCIGNGNHFIFVSKEKAMNNKYYSLLKETFIISEKYNVIFVSDKEGSLNSDNKSFETSIGLSACSKSKKNVYYTGRIHTNKDNFIDLDNINYVTNKMKDFIERI